MQKLTVTLIVALLSILSISAQMDPIKGKVEGYIVEKFKPKYFNMIEFGDMQEFDSDQLIKKHKEPEIFKNEQWAHEMNEKVFTWLTQFKETKKISHYVEFICGSKENETENWSPHWGIALIDNDEVVCVFHYAP